MFLPDARYEFSGLTEVTPAMWPRLFKQTPNLEKRLKGLKGNKLYAIVYTNPNPLYIRDFDTLMDKRPGLKGLRDIACSSIQYPSHAVAEHLKLPPEYTRAIHYQSSPSYSRYSLRDIFGESDLTANTEAGELRFGDIHNLALYLALQLIKGDLINPENSLPFSDVKGLKNSLKAEKAPLSVESLHLAIRRAATEDVVNMLSQRKHTPDDGLEDYFRNIAGWNTLLSLDRSFSGASVGKLRQIFPFGSIYDGSNPFCLYYLPYLVASTKLYIRHIPNLLPSGQIFPLPDIKEKLQNLTILCQSTIKAKATDYHEDHVKKVIALTQEQLDGIATEVRRLEQNPNLWYKKELSPRTENLPSIKSIQEEIRNFGGRAPWNLHFGIRQRTQRGQI